MAKYQVYVTIHYPNKQEETQEFVLYNCHSEQDAEQHVSNLFGTKNKVVVSVKQL